MFKDLRYRELMIKMDIRLPCLNLLIISSASQDAF
jgi:hypothetical protein